MGFYIPASWLQVIHYYYFCIGIFSFASSVIFSAYPNYAVIFIVSYILNSAVCWYLSWWIHKKVRRQIILNYNRYFLHHIIAALAAVGFLALLLFSNLITSIILYSPATQRELSFTLVIPEIMDAIVWMNYFAFFTALIWSIGLRFDVINRLFSTYNAVTIGRAKEFVLKKRRELNTGTLVPEERFASYKPGVSDRIDSMITGIWAGRKKPSLKRELMKLELAMGEAHISEMEERLQSLGKSSDLSENDIFIISSYQKLIDKYNKESYRYQQKLEQEEAQG